MKTAKTIKTKIEEIIKWADEYALNESSRHADWHEVEHEPAYEFIRKKLLPKLRRI